MKPKVMVVFGSGRSATSAVARGLHLAGFPMGDELIEPSDSNPWGHYEDRALVRLNDTMLAELDGAWDQPPPVSVVECAVQRLAGRCADYIASRGTEQWGMKDPRLVLLWPAWRAAFDQFPTLDVIRVDVWREPGEIAKSYTRRDGSLFEQGMRLAHAYHERMRRFSR